MDRPRLPTLLTAVVAAALALAGPAALILSPRPALAESEPRPAPADLAAELSAVLLIPEVIALMQEEGADYGRTLEDELFPGMGGARWQAIVMTVYDGPRMRAEFEAALASELGGDVDLVREVTAFFGEGAGKRALSLEIEARRALLDPEVEEAAKVRFARLEEEDPALHDALERFVAANDLIEMNVAGALTSNLAFYQGMAEEGGFGDDMTEDQMLSDVWSQEPDIRTETEDWLYPFLAMAYDPLSEAEMEAYIAFSGTDAGKRLNAAMFAAFDVMFRRISHDLGRAAARQMAGDDI